MAYKPRTEAQKAARRLREGSKMRRPAVYPRCTAPHLTGDALVEFIRKFDRARNFVAGNAYLIGGREVVV